MKSDNCQDLKSCSQQAMVDRITAMDKRLRDLISYTEYIARNLDFAVDYAEFIGKQIPFEINTRDLKATESNPGSRTPSFKQFKKMRMVR